MTDGELQNRMEELYQKQEKCLKVQKCLIVLTMVFFKYGAIPLFTHAFICIIWGGILTNRATSLARKRYPYIFIGPGYGGRGWSWDPYLIAEAKRFGDELTVKIIKFNLRTIYSFIGGLLGYIFMLMLWGLLKEYTGINIMY